MYRDAQLIYEQAAALQIAHAAREPDAGEKLTTAHHRFTATAAPAAVTPTDLGNRYAVLARKEALADQRERAADARERTADDRGQIADAREHAPTSAIGSPMPATGPPMTAMLSLPPGRTRSTHASAGSTKQSPRTTASPPTSPHNSLWSTPRSCAPDSASPQK